ncbi:MULTISPECIES: hypothetical protein [unclassified Bradyrhizobium]|uniref:hypothetical protein n=1 Tax=unclassified Bradyrhizobium TaxID=2631580 RepID=UPI001CD32F75|nr:MULTISPECIES: hypothetical protein [unclassified Bradyrhizobium]
MGEWGGVTIALVSSSFGGTAAAVTRYLVGGADPVLLAALRWGIGFLCLLPCAFLLRVSAALAAGLAQSPPGAWRGE